MKITPSLNFGGQCREVIPYSSCRVVFVDRFGIRWRIMTEQTELQRQLRLWLLNSASRQKKAGGD